MRIFFLLITTICFIPISAQETETEEIPDGWSRAGKIQLLFNQSAFNAEWAGGGTSSLAGNLIFDYGLNYRMEDLTWDNKISGTYGLTKIKEDQFFRKTSDRLEVNSIVGKKIGDSRWFYSFFANFQTQFSRGYEFLEDETGEPVRIKTSQFLSPAYLKAGPGIGWHKSDDLNFNFAPATSKLIFVDPVFTSVPGYSDGDYYGVDRGESIRFEFGASFTGFARFSLFENVVMANSLSLYSNYLDSPGNVDMDYLMNIEMGINDFLSANLIFQAIYDDNTVGAFQVREVFGLGINYGF